MEVISTLISHVGESIAGKDAIQVMKLIEPSLVRKSCSSDMYRMAHTTAVRIAICVGEKFGPFLAKIIPGLALVAAQDIEMVITVSPELALLKNPAGSDEPFSRIIEVPVEGTDGSAGGKQEMLQTIIPGTNRAVAYSKDDMEEKEAAVYTLFMYASNL